MRRRSTVYLGLALASALASSARAEDPAAAYKANCAKCHGDTGLADTPSGKTLKVKPIADDARLAGMSAADLVAAVKGAEKHKGIVAKLTDAQIDASAQYVKTLAAAPVR